MRKMSNENLDILLLDTREDIDVLHETIRHISHISYTNMYCIPIYLDKTIPVDSGKNRNDLNLENRNNAKDHGLALDVLEQVVLEVDGSADKIQPLA